MSHDRKFFDTVMLIIGALVLFSVAMIILSEVIGGGAQEEFISEDPAVIGMIEEQIAPTGKVAIAGQDAPPVVTSPPPAATPVAVVEQVSGEEVYNAACVVCHGAGIAGAPKVGDVAAWTARIAQGTDKLYSNAIDGYQGAAGVMPAKGGRVDLSDDAVRAAVDYMTSQSQ